jgi:two-component system nitrogen regulation response regulator GlnG/two-component system response regulator HydG
MSFPLLKTTAPPISQCSSKRPILPIPALVVVGCTDEPWREGEVSFYDPSNPRIRWFGRGGKHPIEDYSSWDPHLPGYPFPPQLGIAGCFHGDGISRSLGSVRPVSARDLEIENHGGGSMFVNGVEMKKAIVPPGQLIRFDGGLLFLTALRLPEFPPLRYASITHRFGEVDAFGIVGEGPHAWYLRDEATRIGQSGEFVLIFGESGTGKTAIARLMHKVSSRSRGVFSRRNCGAFANGIAALELFGKVANVPNPGPAVEGIFPAAEGGTLFLDEVGLLSKESQGALLTPIEDRKYFVLGDPRQREVDVRIIAATNLRREDLKHDFQNRFGAEIYCAAFRDRREDIPLLVRHLLRQQLKADPSLMRLFWKGPSGDLYPRMSLRLLEFLVGHELSGNARELGRLLFSAIGNSPGDRFEMFPEGSPVLSSSRPSALVSGPEGPATSSARPSGPVSAPSSSEKASSGRRAKGDLEVTREQVLAALESTGGNVSEAARRLEINRTTLTRRMAELGIPTRK